MFTILITGGTGLIGTELTKLLTGKGHHVIIVSRQQKQSTTPNITYAKWDVEKQWIDEKAIEACDYIIHLAGAGVADKRWTEARKQEIVNSRVKSCKLLVKALKEIPNKVKAVISSSAIGWYGDDSLRPLNTKAFTEDLPANNDFLGNTCKLWEESIEPVKVLGKRLVLVRTGIVLSNKGGALEEFKKPVKFGVATILGSGKQVISWIEIDDLCRLFLFAIEHEIEGAFNAVAPNPITNKELILALAQKMKGRFYIPIPVPAFAVKIAVGEMSVEVLKSATVSSEKISKAGFTFLFPTIEAALPHLF